MASENKTVDASLSSKIEGKTIVFALLNTVGFAVSLFVIIPASLQLLHAQPGCGYTNSGWKLAFGVYLLAAAVVGYLMVYTNCQNKVLLAIYISMAIAFFVVAAAVLLLVPNVRDIFASDDSAGNVLKTYSPWMRKRLVDEKWDTTRSCLVREEICKRSFNKTTKTSMEANCCFPPEHCGFKYKNHTHWEVPESGLDSRDPDCFTWSKKPGDVCYECDSCKAGYMSSFETSWMDFGFKCFLISLLFVFTGILFIEEESDKKKSAASAKTKP